MAIMAYISIGINTNILEVNFNIKKETPYYLFALFILMFTFSDHLFIEDESIKNIISIIGFFLMLSIYFRVRHIKKREDNANKRD